MEVTPIHPEQVDKTLSQKIFLHSLELGEPALVYPVFGVSLIGWKMLLSADLETLVSYNVLMAPRIHQPDRRRRGVEVEVKVHNYLRVGGRDGVTTLYVQKHVC